MWPDVRDVPGDWSLCRLVERTSGTGHSQSQMPTAAPEWGIRTKLIKIQGKVHLFRSKEFAVQWTCHCSAQSKKLPCVTCNNSLQDIVRRRLEAMHQVPMRETTFTMFRSRVKYGIHSFSCRIWLPGGIQITILCKGSRKRWIQL